MENIQTNVAGVTFYDTDFSLISVKSIVNIIPEPNNEYDNNALKVLIDGNHVGYINKDINKGISKKIEEGYTIKSKVKSVIGGGEYNNGIVLSITLNDIFVENKTEQPIVNNVVRSKPEQVEINITKRNKNKLRSSLSGYEYAREHIREAKILSAELGGTDKDVKKYFFSLSSQDITPIMDEYETLYGFKARDYAEETMGKWKIGKVQMSGMVAERLFSLLPPRMPLSIKYQLINSLWEHVGASSSKTYYISSDVDVNELVSTVKSYLENVVISHTIPEGIEKRFNWLSQGDVEIKQKLLNYLRDKNKKLLTDNLESQLNILSNHLNNEGNLYTKQISQVLKVGKHEVKIILNEQANGITEKKPEPIPSPDSEFNWIWWVIGGLLILWLFNH